MGAAQRPVLQQALPILRALATADAARFHGSVHSVTAGDRKALAEKSGRGADHTSSIVAAGGVAAVVAVMQQHPDDGELVALASQVLLNTTNSGQRSVRHLGHHTGWRMHHVG